MQRRSCAIASSMHDEMTRPAQPIELPHLPLFPLKTVLFPGGLLALKIFEARYLDMVSE